jgi:hypothetical protein
MVDRYKITLVNTNDGHLVKYGDYQRLESEVASLKQQLSPLSSATPSYVAGLEEEIAQKKIDLKLALDLLRGERTEIEELRGRNIALKEDFKNLVDEFTAANITTFS